MRWQERPDAQSLPGHPATYRLRVKERNVIGQVVETDLWVHFPIPMRNAWDNVIYTCSTMLLFENKEAVEIWCRKHRIDKGDVQPITKIWEFSKAWYGSHLNPEWQKWTAAEAKRIFEQFELTDDVWKIPVSDRRF
jgi:hypothetical protein